MTGANIIEIFSSIQGEGPYVGERHLFVRFQGCPLRCRYCDTPEAFIRNPRCRAETVPFSNRFDYYENPLSVSQLNTLLQSFNGQQVLVVTGGEPLAQSDFLKDWFPTLDGRYRVLLETAGIHVQGLRDVLKWIDIISMDIKLPSVTGMQESWEAHRAFIAIAKEKGLYVKVVVSSETDKSDLEQAIQIVAETDSDIPFVLQKASSFAGFHAVPSQSQLAYWEEMAQARLSNVRQIPQLHKLLKVL